MSNDITTRLRALCNAGRLSSHMEATIFEGADKIEQLRKQIQREMRERHQLEDLIEMIRTHDPQIVEICEKGHT